MKPSTPFRGWLAVLVAPLVIAGWFLWPLVPFNHTAADVIRSVATAYVFFFLARGLAFLATSRPAVHYLLVFLFAFILSYSISLGLSVAGIEESPGAVSALLDAFWCTAAAAIYTLIAGIK